jgi:hypothetical protein
MVEVGRVMAGNWKNIRLKLEEYREKLKEYWV